MKIYRQYPTFFEAYQVTEDNLEKVEAWCNGSIKGTKLPRKEREIEIFTNETEMRAEVGDFIVLNLRTNIFNVFTEKVFRENFAFNGTTQKGETAPTRVMINYEK